MNEYTRREEIRWTLVSVGVLVPAVAVAILKLVLAQGPLVPDPAAVEAQQAAMAQEAGFKVCIKAADEFGFEAEQFKRRVGVKKEEATKAAIDARNIYMRNLTRYPLKPGEVKYDIPWSATQPLYERAKTLETQCRALAETAVPGGVDAAQPAWKLAYNAARKIEDPGDPKACDGKKGDEQTTCEKELKEKQHAQGLKLESWLDKETIDFDKLKRHVDDTKKELATNSAAATQRAETEKLRAPLPEGLFPRGAAIAVGVGVALAALIISYVSVQSASKRRALTLHGLRRFANTPEAGLQAAAIVRLAAHHNGGEPGIVVGSALGGLVAALLANPEDPNAFIGDLFVAGSMGGLLIGLAGQWLVRTLSGMRRWRDRTKELGEIEKPTIPVVLVLGGVTPGLEKQFIRYFEALPVADAAVVVQKLAAQAEEQILMAADARGAGPGIPGNAPWAR